MPFFTFIGQHNSAPLSDIHMRVSSRKWQLLTHADSRVNVCYLAKTNHRGKFAAVLYRLSISCFGRPHSCALVWPLRSRWPESSVAPYPPLSARFLPPSRQFWPFPRPKPPSPSPIRRSTAVPIASMPPCPVADPEVGPRVPTGLLRPRSKLCIRGAPF